MATRVQDEKRRPSAASAPAPSATPPDASPRGSRSNSFSSISAPPVAAPGAGLLTCLVTPKLTFSVPRSPNWQTAAEVPQAVLREGFSRRFPLTLSGLQSLRFEAVGRGTLPEKKSGEPQAVYRLTSADEAEERVLLSLLRALEQAYESKHRLALDQARTDMLSSSMTFQVMADEIRARQDEARAKFDKDTRGLKDSLTSTSKRLFLLEQEKDVLTRTVQGHTEANGNLRCAVERLREENSVLKSTTQRLEGQLAEVLARMDEQYLRLRASEEAVSELRRAPRAAAAPPVDTAPGSSQTELVVGEAARVLAVSSAGLRAEVPEFVPGAAAGVAEAKGGEA